MTMSDSHRTKSSGSVKGSRRSSVSDFRGSPVYGSKLHFEPTENGNYIEVDPNQVVFKSSSLALLRAKKSGHGWKVDSFERDGEISIEGAKKVMKFVYKMWIEKKMCDVIIKTQGTEEHGHKLALGAYSSYLEHCFSGYPQGTIVSLDASEYPPKVITTILHFIYTTDITINDEQIGDILGCARHLGIDILCEICEEYLTKYTMKTAVQYYSIAKKYKMKNMQTSIYKFVCLHFADITKTDSFFYIPHDKLYALASDDRLMVNSELDVFFAIIRWIDYNRQERLCFAPELMSCVRFTLITPEQLVTKVEVMEHIFVIPECQKLLYKAMCFHALIGTKSHLAGQYGTHQMRSYSPNGKSPPQRETTCTSECQTIGDVHPTCWDHHEMDASPVQPHVRHTTYSAAPVHRTSLHLQVNGPPYPLYQQSSVPDLPDIGGDELPIPSHKRRRTMDDEEPTEYYSFHDTSGLMKEYELPELLAVAVGGIDLHHLDSAMPGKHIYRFDTNMNRWVAFTMLRSYTHHHAVASVGGSLYVVGGAIYDHQNPEELGRATSATFMFDPLSATWRVLAPMKESRAYHGMTSYEDSLFVVGGEDYSKRCLDTVEFYDPDENEWSYLTRLPSGGRIGAAVATYKDAIYIVGGYNKDKQDGKILAEVATFDLLNQTWTQKRPLSVARCHASLVVARDRLFLIGGRTRIEGRQPVVTSLSMVEIYHDDTDTWEHITDLTVPRHDAGCAVIESKIFIVGGMRTPSLTCLNSVECFDVDIGQWDTSVEQLPYAAAGLACCTIHNSA